MRCLNFCPRNGIDAAQGWTVFVFYVAHLPVGVWAFGQAFVYGLGLRLPFSSLPMNLGNYPWFLFTVSSLYWYLVSIARVPILARLLRYQTMTGLYRRYREPDTTIGDFLD